MAYNRVVGMMATSEAPVKLERALADPGGQGHEPLLIAQETIRSISCLRNFPAETKATLLPSQIAEHLSHSGLQFNSVQCVLIHGIDRNFLSVPSSNIHGPQATSAVSCSLAHFNLNSHFKLAHQGVTRKVSGSTTEITLTS